MKVLMLTFFIVLFFICVITYPFKIKGAVHINALENIGFAVIKVFNLRLFNGKFKITHDGHISMEKEKNKKKKQKNIKLHQFYFMCLAKKIDIKKGEFFFTGGSTNDACFVSLISGYINVLVSSVFAVLMTKYKNMKAFISVEPDYERNKIELTASGVISFSLLDMLESIICATAQYLKERRREEKNV